VVGDRPKIFLYSALTSMTAKLVTLALAVGMAYFTDLHMHRFLLWCQAQDEYTDTHCNNQTYTFCTFYNQTYNNSTMDAFLDALNATDFFKKVTAMIFPNDTHSYNIPFEPCFYTTHPEVLMQNMRVCETADWETPLRLSLLAGLLVSTALALLATLRLHKFSIYSQLHSATSSCCWFPTSPVLHRAFLIQLVRNDMVNELEKVLIEENKQHAKGTMCCLRDKGHIVNTPDQSGETPLHFACKFGFTRCAQLLVAAGAQSLPNSLGQGPKYLRPGMEHLMEEGPATLPIPGAHSWTDRELSARHGRLTALTVKSRAGIGVLQIRARWAGQHWPHVTIASRYGDTWSPRRKVSSGAIRPGEGNETIELAEGEVFTAGSGFSEDTHGYMLSLALETSRKEGLGPYGDHQVKEGRSLRSSLGIPGLTLHHLSGSNADTEGEEEFRLCFHWARTQGAE
jgi:hypothetical protein